MNPVQALDVPDYSQFHNSIEIPFTNDASENLTPAIDLWVEGRLIKNVGLDSGSTVFAIGVNLAKDYFPSDPSHLKRGEIYFRSSKRRWEGYWFPVKVTFKGLEDRKLTAEVEALIITEQTCKGKTEDDQGIHYLGTRFGKTEPEKAHTPDKNALLSITHYNDKPVDSSNFRHGYIMRRQSIIVGITKQNTKSFKYTKLSPGDHPGIKYDWSPVGLALRLNDGAWMHGTLLVDSGIGYMILQDPQKSDTSEKLPAGTKVTVRFPGENSYLAEYGFVWPGEEAKKEPWLPSTITYAKGVHGKAFVNTGRNFGVKFDTLYDADGGYWGVRDATE